MRFFMPKGTEISAEEFVKKYSEDYFLKAPGEKGLVPGLRRSSEKIEEEITAILFEGIQSKQDVARILAWKIGKIKHRESEENSKRAGKVIFSYSNDWERADELKDVHLYDKENEFPIDKIAEYLYKERKSLEVLAVENPQRFLDRINAKDFPRIGTVYMITLLYFFSHGEHPIYDRFAMLALSAIDSEKSPNLGEKVCVDVKFKEMPSKESSRFATIMDNEMSIYEEKFNEAFGAYKESVKSNLAETELKRKFDQALWVYGHLFTDDKKIVCR